MSDPHDWNSWENYRNIHDNRMLEHPFVVEDHLEWELIGDPSAPDLIRLVGIVLCHREVVVDIVKTLETRRIGQGRIQCAASAMHTTRISLADTTFSAMTMGTLTPTSFTAISLT